MAELPAFAHNESPSKEAIAQLRAMLTSGNGKEGKALTSSITEEELLVSIKDQKSGIDPPTGP